MMVIGYTTGVFDLFHIGHLNILRNAKMLCDVLIAGVTTDELCFERKHKTPIVPFDERIEIVEHIKFVDRVVPQTDMDKFAAWERLKFKKIFVGSDWQGTKAWQEYEKQFAPFGVDIIYLPHTDGVSSTMRREILIKISSGGGG